MDMTKFKRFSMCNCLTVRMDKLSKKANPKVIRTYTAHLMTLDLFLKLAKPGMSLDVPFKKYWPKQKYIRTYHIPKKVTTFLFSPFNESWHPTFRFDTNVSYVVPKRLRKAIAKESAKHNMPFTREKKGSILQFKKNIKALDKKVTSLWSPRKILVLYDNTWAPKDKKSRLDAFNQIARKTLKWPCVQIKQKRNKPTKEDLWQHYSNAIYLNLQNQIEDIEKELK